MSSHEKSGEERKPLPLTFSTELVRAAMALLDPEFVLSEEAEARVATVMSRRAAELLEAKLNAR
jgi:hypothetical protein